MLPQARPAFIDMYIHPCHRHCRHCFAAQGPAVGGLMDVARFRRYTSRIQDAASGPAPLFASWELVPFADAIHHPDVLQLVAQMESLGNPSLRVLSSDCWRVAHDPDWEPLLDNLRENHVWGFHLTLYGMENTHDWFAGKKGSFAAIELAVERLLAKGFQVAWVIILHEKNAPETEEMLRWIAARTPGASIDMIPFTFSGSGEKHAADAISPRSFARLSPEVRARIRPDLRTEREWRQLAAEGIFPVPPLWDRLSRTINLQILHDGAVVGGIEGCIPLGHMENDRLADLVSRHDRLLLPYYQEQKQREQELLAWVAAQKHLGAEDILSTASNQLKLWKRKRDLPLIG